MGVVSNVPKLVGKMLKSKENWSQVEYFIVIIIQQKEIVNQ